MRLQKHHIIYVPGIGDDVYKGQSTAIRLWWVYGVRAHCHEIPWAGSEPYEVKFKRLLADIDVHLYKGHTVSLIGASAGATAVLQAYALRQDKIHAVALVCGKVNRPKAVSSYTYGANPAFQTSMSRVGASVESLNETAKARIVSFYSAVDRTVPPADSKIPGVEEVRLPDLSHSRAIAYSITLGAPRVIRELKKIK